MDKDGVHEWRSPPNYGFLPYNDDRLIAHFFMALADAKRSSKILEYYMRIGMCKYETSCKYHHTRQGGGTAGPVALSISGYPIRPGEKECSYYAKTGQCKFGVTCKFHHPQTSGIQVPPSGPAIYPTLPSSHQQYGVVSGNWQVARPTLIPGSYIQGDYCPILFPSGVDSFPSYSPYQTHASPIASPSNQSSIGAPPVYGVTQLYHSTPAYTGTYLSLPSIVGPSSGGQKEQPFPERPGQPECQYYMKTGDCKFGSSCRYHHLPDWSITKVNVVLSPMGLPLRPVSTQLVIIACALSWGSSCDFALFYFLFTVPLSVFIVCFRKLSSFSVFLKF
ncbi:zinc finger CCCH domain-containing protein 32-like [Impatiens glandulifera]|uniref:zinc finger CCCH domain-containing protein 32-like n=1 Tax=Impatiens glandulifera TaxID=253017 RepID=UPI001FB19841|nr:zinc finger CCCH domain-containing protein 32-like [Impatiens glandulifera]